MDDHARAALDVLFDVLVAEYKELKAEQRDRMGLRDGLVYAALGSQAAVVATILAGKAGSELLLALPAVAFVLGMVRLAAADKTAEIRRYIRGPVRQNVVALLGDVPFTPFGWESHPSPRRAARRLGQLVSDLVVFVAVPAGGLTHLIALPAPMAGLAVAAAVGDLILLVLLAVEILQRADLGSVAR